MLKRNNLCRLIFFLFVVSVFSCASSEETKKEDMPAQNNVKNLPPGSANVRALVLGISKDNDSSFCDVRIKEVMGYGSSTPPLPVGSEIRLFYDTKNVNEIDGKNLLTDKEILIHINHSIAYGDKILWTLGKFINNN